MKRLTVTGHSHYGKPTRVTLRFDDHGKLLNPRAAAKSSMVGWGEWQHAVKVPSRFGECWCVSTAGHGGYILVTQTKGPFKEPALSAEHAYGRAYVYEFEEDCDWAILEYRDEQVRQHALGEKNSRRNDHGQPRQTDQEYLANTIVPCLRGYNALVLDNPRAGI